MKLAYLLLCLAAGLLACSCASGPREPMPPDIPDQMEEFFVEFKVWTDGGQVRAEKVISTQTRQPKGDAPRSFRVTVLLNKPAELAAYVNVGRGATLLPAYENDYGRLQMFWQWDDKSKTRNVFSTQSFGDTSESWHEAKFLCKAESDDAKVRNPVVEFNVLVVFEGDDAWKLQPPTLMIEAQKFVSCEVPLFAEK